MRKFSRLRNSHKMYLLVLLGLLGTFEMNFYGGAKTQFENGTGTEMCPSLFA